MKKKICSVFVLLVLFAVIFAETEVKTVFVTEKGKKYHSENCRTLAKSKDLIQLTLEEAIEKGYKVCKVCGGK